MLTYVALFATYAVGYTLLLRYYERTGRAVRLPNRTTRTLYESWPRPVLALRWSFAVVVAVMLWSGLVSRTAAGQTVIIATVLALFVLGILSVLLDRHYVKTGRARQVEFD